MEAKHIENALSGIQCSVSDSRALCNGFFPLPQRSHLAEPEGISAALKRPDRVNPAALVIEPAASVRFLTDTESGFNRSQEMPGQIRNGYFKKISKNLYFPSADPDDARISRATRPAAQAFETDSVIKEIPAMIVIVRVAFHMGFDL